MKALRRRSRGISLIEVMIALVLMALVGVMAERGLSQMLRARDMVVGEQQRWRDIAFAFGRFSEDVAFAANGIPNETSLQLWQGGGDSARWTRWDIHGQVLPLRYTLAAGQLQRLAEAEGDETAEPAAAVLLEHVGAMQIRFLDSGGAWHASWPVEGSSVLRPRAVSLTLTLREGVALERIFSLP